MERLLERDFSELIVPEAEIISRDEVLASPTVIKQIREQQVSRKIASIMAEIETAEDAPAIVPESDVEEDIPAIEVQQSDLQQAVPEMANAFFRYLGRKEVSN